MPYIQLVKIELNPRSKSSYTALVAAEELDFATGYEKAETTLNAEYIHHDVSQASKYTLRILVGDTKGPCRALNLQQGLSCWVKKVMFRGC